MKLTDAQVLRAMFLLGLGQGDFQAVQTAPTFEEGVKRLDDLKARAKKAFKKAALDLHPDRTNNDPAKTEDFKLVSSAVDEIDKLVLHKPQPRPQVQYIRIHFTSHGFSTGTSTTASTTTYWNGYGF